VSWDAELYERDEYVVALVEMTALGAGSGVVAPLPRHGQVHRFRDGLIELHRMCPDSADAFIEAGIDPPTG
jgi:hypothetical protein